jgi:hypothetical protein
MPLTRTSIPKVRNAKKTKRNSLVGCFLKDKFWRITTKHGGQREPAVMAVAHNLLRFVFQVLSTGQPYQARSATPLEPQQRERLIRHHIRRLGKLGVPVGQRGPHRFAHVGAPPLEWEFSEEPSFGMEDAQKCPIMHSSNDELPTEPKKWGYRAALTPPRRVPTLPTGPSGPS